MKIDDDKWEDAEIDAMQAAIDAQRVKPLICVCGEQIDETARCGECVSKMRQRDTSDLCAAELTCLQGLDPHEG